MRKRKHCIRFYLNDEELLELNRKVKQTNIKRDGFLRKLIDGCEIVECPPVEYGDIVKELRRIGANVDQLLVVARVKGFVDELKLKNISETVKKMDNLFIRSFSGKG